MLRVEQCSLAEFSNQYCIRKWPMIALNREVRHQRNDAGQQ
jgi:hypothetical protein